MKQRFVFKGADTDQDGNPLALVVTPKGWEYVPHDEL